MTNQELKLKKMQLMLKGFAVAAFFVVGSLFGTAALIYSANPAQADAPTTINEAGRYQMQMQATYTPSLSDTYFYILVWDTSSGRSKMYYGSTKKGKMIPGSSGFNLPSSPL